MFKKLFSLVLLAGMLGSTAFAQAVKVGVVDFNRVMHETNEGKAAKARLDSMLAGKQAELEQKQANVQAMIQDYQVKAPTMNAEARQAYEQRIMEGQGELQQFAAMNEQEMQVQLAQVMDTVFNSLKGHAEAIGKAEGFTVILESSQGAVLFAKDGIDLTDRVIAKANGR